MFEYAMLYHGQTGQAIQVSQGETPLNDVPDFFQVNAIAGSEHSANSWHYQVQSMIAIKLFKY